MLAVADGRPETMGLKGDLAAFHVNFQYEVIQSAKYNSASAKGTG